MAAIAHRAKHGLAGIKDAVGELIDKDGFMTSHGAGFHGRRLQSRRQGSHRVILLVERIEKRTTDRLKTETLKRGANL
jgi:hypothetical protein